MMSPTENRRARREQDRVRAEHLATLADSDDPIDQAVAQIYPLVSVAVREAARSGGGLTAESIVRMTLELLPTVELR